MTPENVRKADELVRALGRLGLAQENGSEETELTELAGHAVQLHSELATEITAAHS